MIEAKPALETVAELPTGKIYRLSRLRTQFRPTVLRGGALNFDGYSAPENHLAVGAAEQSCESQSREW